MKQRFGLRMWILALLLALAVPLLAETAAERWVAEKVRAGQAADLMLRSPGDPAGRELSAEFLRRLLEKAVHREGLVIRHGIVKAPLDLQRIEARADIELARFEFLQSVDLSGAHFRKDLVIKESVFLKGLRGYRLVVDGDFSIGGSRLDVRSDARNAEFKDDVDLRYAVIGGSLAAHMARFERSVDLSIVRVGGRGQFQRSEFAGPTRFTRAAFTDEVNFSEARFTEKGADVSFNSMKVGYLAIFDKASFAGAADFKYMVIESSFQADEMKFTNPRGCAKFSGTKLRKLYLDGANFAGACVEMFGVASIELEFHDVMWPDDPNRFECQDVTYSRIVVDKQKKPALMTWPESSRYSPSVYLALAKYLEDHGDAESASDVRVNRQKREAATLPAPKRLWNLLLLGTCAYGERPWYAFAWIAVFVGIGWWVFRSKTGMELTDPAQPDPGYNPFWYSLGLFLPVVDIGLIKAWRPDRRRRFAMHYAQIHVLLGWFFLPIALASITGILK